MTLLLAATAFLLIAMLGSAITCDSAAAASPSTLSSVSGGVSPSATAPSSSGRNEEIANTGPPDVALAVDIATLFVLVGCALLVLGRGTKTEERFTPKRR